MCAFSASNLFIPTCYCIVLPATQRSFTLTGRSPAAERMLSLSRSGLSHASARQHASSRHALQTSRLCGVRSTARKPAARTFVATAAAADAAPVVGPVCTSLLNLPTSSWESLQQLVTPTAKDAERLVSAVQAVEYCGDGTGENPVVALKLQKLQLDQPFVGYQCR